MTDEELAQKFAEFPPEWALDLLIDLVADHAKLAGESMPAGQDRLQRLVMEKARAKQAFLATFDVVRKGL